MSRQRTYWPIPRADVAPADVLVHPAEVVPVVHERDHEPEAQLAGLGDRVVEPLEAVRPVVVRRPARSRIPVLKVDALLGAAADVRRAVVQVADVERAPDPHDAETLRVRGLEHVVDHEGRLVDQVVLVRAGEAELRTSQPEVGADALDELGVLVAVGCRLAGGRRHDADAPDHERDESCETKSLQHGRCLPVRFVRRGV
jgi:hypothetical protein